MANSFSSGQHRLGLNLACTRCPRLVAYREENQRLFPDFHNRPVSGYGDRKGGLFIVGLAPGLRGANRTGYPFTGDYAGGLLYTTLSALGLAREDGDRWALRGCVISNAVKCVPPQNKPTALEIHTCRTYLVAELQVFRPRVILALGRIAHESVVRALGARPGQHPFSHGGQTHIGGVLMISSYHCSRYNTQTKRLTASMFRSVLEQAHSMAL